MKDRTDIAVFEKDIGKLLQLLESLQKENRALRARHDTLLGNRSRLIEKNEIARTKMESMIARLKSLETGE